MRHIRSLSEANLSTLSVVTIGAFDGVHRGHQMLIGRLVEQARASGAAPVVLTFYPHPRMVLSGFEPGFYLTLPDDKARLLGKLGVDLVVTHPFDDEVRHIRAADFVERLIAHLNMKALWVGEDFAMGYNREGNVRFLREQGQQRGFSVEVVDLMDAGDERVSSSRIRDALDGGDVAEAERLLGRPYFVRGEVVEGAHRGRMIGFPTANVDVPVELRLPARGVYAGWASVGGRLHGAAINVGVRPTFDGSHALTLEAFLLDYSGSLYGQHLQVHFAERLRDERRFDGVEALVAQIQHDAEQARAALAARTFTGVIL